MYKLFTLVLVFLLMQTDWLKEAQHSVNRIDNQAQLIDKTKHKKKKGQTVSKKFVAGDFEKLTVTYDYSDLLNIDISYYSQDSFLLAERIVGQDILIYKRERLPNEPYAKLIESNVYFKSMTFGIENSRELNIYESDNIGKLKLEIKNRSFKVDTLDSNDYRRIFDKFISAKTRHNKGLQE